MYNYLDYEDEKMKKIISIFLSCIMLLGVLVIPSFAENGVNVSVSSESGFASQAVEVEIKLDDAVSLSAMQIKINYDKKLQLIKVESGSDITDAHDVSGAENGSYTFVGLSLGSKASPNTSFTAGTVVATLTFVIPSDAEVGDEYNVSVSTLNSKLVTTDETDIGKVKDNPITVTNGKITVEKGSPCSKHSFADEVKLSEQSYIHHEITYKECTKCQFTELTKKAPFATNIIEHKGNAIVYTGQPRGLASAFIVNKEAVSAIEALGYSVEIRTEIVKTGTTEILEQTLFYGNGVLEESKAVYDSGVIYEKIEGISSLESYNIYASVKIIDEKTGEFYEEINYATVKGNANISIYSIVNIMTISKYDATSRQYLEGVKNGVLE